MAVFPPVIGHEAGDNVIPSPLTSRLLNHSNSAEGVAAAGGEQEEQRRWRRRRQEEGGVFPEEGRGAGSEAGHDALSSSPVVLGPAAPPSPFTANTSSLSSLSLSTSSPSRSPSPLPSSSLPALRHINLGRCDGVTDRALARVAGAFPGLEGVRLEHCLKVTDVGVAALAAGCPGLRALGLRNCGQVHARCLRVLFAHTRARTCVFVGMDALLLCFDILGNPYLFGRIWVGTI